MALAPRWLDRNLTRLELVAVIAIFTVLIATFATQAVVVFARAEQRFLDASILNMNSVLGIYGFQLLADGRGEELARLRGTNPLALQPLLRSVQDPEMLMRYPELGSLAAGLSAILNDYQGEFDLADPAQFDGGMWYFERADGTLVYRVQNDEFFRSGLAGAARIRYRLDVQFEDRDGNRRFTPGSDLYVKLVIAPQNPSTWIFFQDARDND